MIGAGQCNEGVRSRPAPVCSFHRQVNGTDTSEHPAAMKCANGRPNKAASSPQNALPTVKVPKNTVTKIASPLARTQSGNAICADTFNVESAAIQDAPASMQA